MSPDDFKEMADFLQQAESIRPLINMALDTLESFTPELQRIAGTLSDVVIENRLQSIDKYMKAGGFSREIAIQLTMADARLVRNFFTGKGAQSPSLWTTKKTN